MDPLVIYHHGGHEVPKLGIHFFLFFIFISLVYTSSISFIIYFSYIMRIVILKGLLARGDQQNFVYIC